MNLLRSRLSEYFKGFNFTFLSQSLLFLMAKNTITEYVNSRERHR